MATARHITNQRIGLLKQADWATPSAASALFKTLNYDAGVSIIQPFSVKNQQNYAIGSGTVMETEDKLVTEYTIGLSRLPFRAKISKGLLAFHLAAAFQSVTEAELTPFAKTFVPADDPQFDFSANEGYVYTIAGDTYNDGATVGDGFLLKNAILDTLTVRVDNMAEGLARNFEMEGSWIGNACSLDQYLSGVWVAKPADSFFHTAALRCKADLVIGTVDIDDICWHNFEATINNQVSAECITDKVNNYFLKTIIDVVLRIKYTSATYKILSSFQAGTNFALDFYNGLGSSDGQLKFSFTKGYLTDVPKIIDGDYFGLELRARIIKPTAGWATAITFTDAIDGGY